MLTLPISLVIGAQQPGASSCYMALPSYGHRANNAQSRSQPPRQNITRFWDPKPTHLPFFVLGCDPNETAKPKGNPRETRGRRFGALDSGQLKAGKGHNIRRTIDTAPQTLQPKSATWLVILGSAPGSATVFGVSPFFIWRRGVEVVAMVLFRRFEKRNVGSGFWVCGKKWGHVATVFR